MTRFFAPGLTLTLLILGAGCFTIHQTPPTPCAAPTSHVPPVPSVRVGVTGFASTWIDYLPVYGQSTAWVDTPLRTRRGHWVRSGHYETITTESYIPRERLSLQFAEQFQTHLEENGYIVRGDTNDFTVVGSFDGPFITNKEKSLEWLCMLGSILSAEYATQTWTSELKIYEPVSGRLLLRKTYSQKYANVVWSPLFFVGLACYEENSQNFMQGWCLAELTHQMADDTLQFLSQQKR